MDKKLAVLLSVFFLGALSFISIVTLNKNIVTLTRANKVAVPSAEKTVMLGWPLTVKSDGVSTSKVTVFVRTEKGVPVKDVSVDLKADLGDVRGIQVKTDKKGKAVFEVSSDSPGKANISAFLNGKLEVKQKLSIFFE